MIFEIPDMRFALAIKAIRPAMKTNPVIFKICFIPAQTLKFIANFNQPQ